MHIGQRLPFRLKRNSYPQIGILLLFFSFVTFIFILLLKIRVLWLLIVVTLLLIMLILLVINMVTFFSLTVRKDGIQFHRKSVFNLFSFTEEVKYAKMRELTYVQGYFNIPQMIFQTINKTAGYGGFSRPDRIILALDDESLIIVNKVGKRKEFEYLAKFLKDKVHIAANFDLKIQPKDLEKTSAFKVY